jgi:isopenicillin N synthase-like dioxygenase
MVVEQDLIVNLEDLGFHEIQSLTIPRSFPELASAFDIFFEQTADQKMVYWQGDNPIPFRGYFPPLKQNYDVNGLTKDLKEGFDFGPDLLSEQARYSSLHFFGQNIWPKEIPLIEALVTTALTHFRSIADLVLNHLDSTLEASGHVQPMQPLFSRPVETLRVLNYPAKAAEDKHTTPLVEHIDPGFLTFVFSQSGELEFFNQKLKIWVPVQFDAPKLILITGHFLEKVTGGRFRAPVHRISRTDRSRRSLCYFFNPNYDSKFLRADSGLALEAGKEIFCCSIGYSEDSEYLYKDQLRNRVW